MYPTVPLKIATAVVDRWPNTGAAWLGQVEDELIQLCQKYRAQPIGTFPARFGFVVEAETPHGPIVMRSSPDPLGPVQAEVSQALASLKVSPAIREVMLTPTGTWTVADRVIPGTTVWGESPALESLAHMLSPLKGQPAPNNTMPSIADWLRKRLEDDSLSDVAPGTDQVAPEVRAHALATLNDLASTPLQSLCHGDTSPGNILKAGHSRLMMIDPRGVRGEVAYDLAVIVIKTSAASNSARRIEGLAQLLDIDAERVRAWIEVAEAARV